MKLFTVLEARMSSSENEVEEIKRENAGKIHEPLLKFKISYYVHSENWSDKLKSTLRAAGCSVTFIVMTTVIKLGRKFRACSLHPNNWSVSKQSGWMSFYQWRKQKMYSYICSQTEHQWSFSLCASSTFTQTVQRWRFQLV